MTKFKQFGKLPGRPSELIRWVLQHRGKTIGGREEIQAHDAYTSFSLGAIKDGFQILGISFPKTIDPMMKISPESPDHEADMLDMARQLEERGY